MWRYGPLLLWMALIYVGSTNLLSSANTNGPIHRILLFLLPTLGEERAQMWHFVIRKCGHLAEYGVLALLAARSFTFATQSAVRAHALLFSFLLIAIYSLLDEYHQSFVASRGASVHDSLIDMAGGAVALMLLVVWRKKSGRIIS